MKLQRFWLAPILLSACELGPRRVANTNNSPTSASTPALASTQSSPTSPNLPSTTNAVSAAPAAQPPFIEIDAESMPTRSVGAMADGGGWNLWSNGKLEQSINFPSTGIYRFEIVARGSSAYGIWPNAQIRVDNSVVANITVDSASSKSFFSDDVYRVTLGPAHNISAGAHQVAIAFTNDASNSSEDRNLIVEKLRIAFTATVANNASAASVGSGSLRQAADTRGLKIGSAISTSTLNDPQQTGVLQRDYSSIVAENEMKPATISLSRGHYNFAPGDTLAAWAAQNNISLRGHTLVWHEHVPTWIQNGNYTRSQLITILTEYVHDVVTHFRGKVVSWDVVNEAADWSDYRQNSFWYQKIGPEFIDIAFKAARAADPNVKLFYNDYGAEDLGAKSEMVYSMMKDLKTRGIPVDGVGLQMHLSENDPLDTDGLLSNMRRLKALGLDVQVSEMDVALTLPPSTTALSNQADLYAAVMRACLMAGNCKTFSMWGFTDKYSWLPAFSGGTEGAGLLFDESLQPKSAYGSLRQVLLGQ